MSLGILWIVSGAVSYYLALSYADDVYDDQLLSSVDSVGARLRLQNSRIDVDLPPAVLAVFQHNNKDKFYFQILSVDGKFIDGDKDFPPPVALTSSKEPQYGKTAFRGDIFRTVLLLAPVEGAPGKDVLVYVAETLHSRRALANHILISTLMSQFAVIVFGTAAVYFGVAHGLAQLDALKNALTRRSQLDLSPLNEEEAPSEVRPLVRSINDLMSRLREDLEAQRRFVANAAHQLRTPLAGLKTYIGYLKRMVTDKNVRPVLEQLDTGADRTTHLINRLLSLTRVEPGASSFSKHQAVDLNFVASDATAALVSEAVEKDIDLAFQASEEPALIFGDVSNLQELVTNLVENAVRYTQHGGAVTVQVQGEEAPQLSVEDNGPGIPAEERERVFERFYRILGTGIPGSGLGLSIVSEIARAHNARVLVQSGKDGTGTRVVVDFIRMQDVDESGYRALEGGEHRKPD